MFVYQKRPIEGRFKIIVISCFISVLLRCLFKDYNYLFGLLFFRSLEILGSPCFGVEWILHSHKFSKPDFFYIFRCIIKGCYQCELSNGNHVDDVI